MKPDNVKPTQTAQREREVAAEGERENRFQRLNPEEVIYWTDAVTAVAAIVPTLAKPKRTCSYLVWSGLLDAYSPLPPCDGIAPHDPAPLSARLMRFTQDAAKPCWPEQRNDLIEFALAFLEADVMLFRSGYTKRHLIKRLQQSRPSPEHIVRIDRLLRRAVINGTGREEFRAYRRLAAHLVAKGMLRDLPTWLAENARGAILTLDKADTDMIADMTSKTAMSEAGRDRIMKRTFFGRSKWGVRFPDLSAAVRAGTRANDEAAQIKNNAYLMLRSVQRRQLCEGKTTGR